MKRTKSKPWLRVAPALAVLAGVSTALAADHLDGPGVKTDPSTDITDLYTWMDGDDVIFVLDVSPLATSASKFSNTAQYVIHTTSTDKFLAGATPVPTDIIATFDANQKIQLWVGSTGFVTGDASGPTGIKSADGKIRVFAGLRDDPFFFNLDGFHAAQAIVQGAMATPDAGPPDPDAGPPDPDAGPPDGGGPLTIDPAGCPQVDGATSLALINALATDPTGDGGAAKDYFAGKNVLAIVVAVHKSLVTSGGPLVAAWASTNKGT